jgi:7-cyano-7-deazaguanine synthase
MHKPYVLVLASGGIDSTACIGYYKKLGFKVEAMFCDYGQLSRRREKKAISSIASYYKINLTIIKISHNKKMKDGFAIGRNALFYFSALMNFKNRGGIISSGIHKGTNYYDCSEDFLNQIQDIFDHYSEGTIMAEAPFINFFKNEIFDYCKLENIPLNLTYSCERGTEQPCGICDTCKDLERIYASKK